jgi:hypothetical protein
MGKDSIENTSRVPNGREITVKDPKRKQTEIHSLQGEDFSSSSCIDPLTELM